MSKRVGNQTYRFSNPVPIASGATVVGMQEGEGPIGRYFDVVVEDDLFGEKTWELAERKMFQRSAELAMSKAGFMAADIECLIGGDLLNQIISASFAARAIGVPFLGQYGACSTLTQSMGVGAMLIDGGFMRRVVCATSSHFPTAERQYRSPLELGSNRPPTAQHTVTGAGACLLDGYGKGPRITHFTPGRVIDWDITDADNMGAAMAPAAMESIVAHLNETSRAPDYYDAIVTGDLGAHGSQLLLELCEQRGYDLAKVHEDCGNIIYAKDQNMKSGASGCGCSAAVFCGFILQKLNDRSMQRVLMVSTGAMLSTTSSLQGESIPGIAHAVAIEAEGV